GTGQSSFLSLTNAFPMPECLERCNSSTSHILTTFASLKKTELSCSLTDLKPLKEWTEWCLAKDICVEKGVDAAKVWLGDVQHLPEMPKEKCEECAKSKEAYPGGCVPLEATVTEVPWVTETACSVKKASAPKTKGNAAMMAL